MPTTEVVLVPLVAGSQPGDPSNPAAAAMKEVGSTLQQQDGIQQIHFGMQVESPDVLQMFINWDTAEHHHRFMASDAYGPFLQRFSSILAGKPEIVHADFSPEGGLPRVLSAPVTEVATFVFDGEVPDGYIDGVNKFGEVIEKSAPAGFLGSIVGTTHEVMEKDGVKGKAVIVALGWSSVDAHMEFRETQVFKENVGALRNGAGKVEMHHTAFMNFVE